ncbi:MULTISPECIES: ABC transporter permease [Anaerococcus]|uniref:ABC transporter permease n=1 Tax=Anaerococcus TaxID=165779 RepID=UPI0029045854|nr:ABC transporter permease [Anaerococcus sp.]MDU2598213.1 ABC transporter permease [Anaerococcus sp.]
MLKMVFKRLIETIPMIITISIVSFLLIRVAPGDPVRAMITPESTVEDIEKIRENMGLNDSYIVQYNRWVKSVLKGDLGYSFSNHRPVADQIKERIPQTLGLMGSALLLSLILGTLIGILSAMNRNGPFDKIFTFLSYIGISIPSFWFAMILIQIFSLKLGWLPSIGMRSLGVNTTSDLIKHSIMPVLTLSISDTATISRYIRSKIISELNQDYVMTEKAQGYSKSQLFFKSILKNSLLPIITIIGMGLPSLISGAFITESIFGWPGLGQLGMNAIFKYDYPLIMATTMLSSLLLIAGNLISDILYMIVDPRISEVD